MANNIIRSKMPVADRAKQFMPFAAVKGLDQALERKRRKRVQVCKKELSEEMAAALNQKLAKLQKGDIITATFYADGEYIALTGALEKLDVIGQCLFISGKYIAFDDLLDIDLPC